jgi:hypothetical protein
MLHITVWLITVVQGHIRQQRQARHASNRQQRQQQSYQEHYVVVVNNKSFPTPTKTHHRI